MTKMSAMVTALLARLTVFDDFRGTIHLLTHFELSRCPYETQGTVFWGRPWQTAAALKVLGFIFLTVTVAVMLATGMVVKGYADGAYTLESYHVRPPLISAFVNHRRS